LTNKYPNILIIGQSFDKNTGSGITLSNLFYKWPINKLAVINIIERPQNTEICNKYYLLGCSEIQYIFPLNKLRKCNDNITNINESNNLINIKNSNKIIHKIGDLTGVNILFKKVIISEKIEKWIKEFNPDIIYTQLQSLHISYLAYQIYVKFNVKLIIHFMDDMPEYLYRDKIFRYLLRKKYLEIVNKLIKKSKICIGISKSMKDEFQKRYNKKFYYFHNSINIINLNKKSDYKSNFTIIYTGRIIESNYSSIKDICIAVNKINLNGHKIIFDIYTLEYNQAKIEKLKYNYNINIHQPLPHKEIQKILIKANLLILPMGFREKDIQFEKHSMPTKTPEYMISGVPILLYSPKEVYLTKFAEEKEWALVVKEKSIDKLIEAIMKIMNNSSLRNKISKNSIKIAKKQFNSKIIRSNFQRIIKSI
jgi:glycosyltransferase involved in cell wall biosynthesis